MLRHLTLIAVVVTAPAPVADSALTQSAPRPDATASQEPACSVERPGPNEVFGEGAVRPSRGTVDYPKPLHMEQPKYTQAAMDAKIQGEVMLEVVVLADGTVGDKRVTKSLDKIYGLDGEALCAADKWRFTPATRDGLAVPVIVTLELAFRLG